MEAFYQLSKVIAFLGSLATMTVLVVFGFHFWAIYPAALAALSGLSVIAASFDTEDPPENPY